MGRQRLQEWLEACTGETFVLTLKTKTHAGAIYHAQGGRKSYLIKTSHESALSEAEVKALKDLLAIGIAVPRIIAYKEGAAVLEYIESIDYHQGIKEHMAAETLRKLHAVSNHARMYGYYYDTPIASFLQRNEQTHYNWALFLAEMRLKPMAKRCFDEKKIDTTHLRRLERVCDRLHLDLDLASIYPSLIHGDVWSGNILYGRSEAVLIDPAIYFADREMEFAFIDLFSTFQESFYRRYFQGGEGFSADYFSFKRPLYQLYPLLVHIALYGRSYVGAFEACLRQVER